MALSKTDQVRFDGLKQTLSMLQSGGMEFNQIKAMMAPQLADFQSMTNHKVNFVERGSDIEFELLNLSRDFIRVRGTDTQKSLRTKIQGVPVEVKVAKEDDYTFSNDDVVSALRALADEVEGLPVDVHTLDITADVRKDLATDNSEDKSDESVVESESELGSEDIVEQEDIESEDLTEKD